MIHNAVHAQQLPATVITYWRPLRPLDDDLQLVFFFSRQDGAIVYHYDQLDADALWYPPSRWPEGAVIRVETPTLAVGRLEETMVAVVPACGRRLVAGGAPQAPAQAADPALETYDQDTCSSFYLSLSVKRQTSRVTALRLCIDRITSPSASARTLYESRPHHRRQKTRGRQTKTRLSPPLSGEQAAALYHRFLLDTLELMRQVEIAQPILAYTPDEAEPFFRSLAPDGFEFVPQVGPDLGERLHNVLSHCLQNGYHQAVVMDSDSPTLPVEHAPAGV